jgi:hypothetical protein
MLSRCANGGRRRKESGVSFERREELLAQIAKVRTGLYSVRACLFEAQATKEEDRIVNRMIDDSETLEENVTWLLRGRG